MRQNDKCQWGICERAGTLRKAAGGQLRGVVCDRHWNRLQSYAQVDLLRKIDADRKQVKSDIAV